MKKWIILIGLALGACHNGLEILDPARTAPVVYGLISPQDSVHLIRLTRTFLATGNAAEVALLPDSLYFSMAEVSLEIRTPAGLVLERIRMDLVPLEDRDAGHFCTSSNRAFRCLPFGPAMASGTKGLTFTLSASVPGSEIAAIAQSRIPVKPSVEFPDYLKRFRQIRFSERKPLYIRKQEKVYTEFSINFRYEENRNGAWNPASIIYTRKYAPGTKPVTLPDNPASRAQLYDSIFLVGDFLCSFIGNRIKDDPAVSTRRFAGIELAILNADPAFWDYCVSLEYVMDVSDLNFTGLVNAYGIFAAYNKNSYPGFTLDQESLDTLRTNRFTRHLNFVGW
jgi:hypothetical protein